MTSSHVGGDWFNEQGTAIDSVRFQIATLQQLPRRKGIAVLREAGFGLIGSAFWSIGRVASSTLPFWRRALPRLLAGVRIVGLICNGLLEMG